VNGQRTAVGIKSHAESSRFRFFATSVDASRLIT